MKIGNALTYIELNILYGKRANWCGIIHGSFDFRRYLLFLLIARQPKIVKFITFPWTAITVRRISILSWRVLCLQQNIFFILLLFGIVHFSARALFFFLICLTKITVFFQPFFELSFVKSCSNAIYFSINFVFDDIFSCGKLQM